MEKGAGASSRVTRRSASKAAASAEPSSTSSKRTASAAAGSRSSASSTKAPSSGDRFVVCVDPGGNDDLEGRRIYRVLPDAAAAKSSYLRIVDDSGEDYLYPERLFLPIALPKHLIAALGL